MPTLVQTEFQPLFSRRKRIIWCWNVTSQRWQCDPFWVDLSFKQIETQVHLLLTKLQPDVFQRAITEIPQSNPGCYKERVSDYIWISIETQIRQNAHGLSLRSLSLSLQITDTTEKAKCQTEQVHGHCYLHLSFVKLLSLYSVSI